MVASTEPLQAALIGIGHDHAWGKAQAILRSAEMTLVGAFEPDAGEWDRQRAQGRYAGVRQLAAHDVLRDPSIDVVFVETPPRDNLRWAREALQHGKHVHLDKPPAPALNDLRALSNLAAEQGRYVQMGYQFRYNPAVAAALHAVREGWLGPISRINADIPTGVDLYAEMRRKDGAYPGTIFYTLGCHILDLVMVFLGKPNDVWSSLRCDAREQGEAFVDSATAVLEYPHAVAVLQTWITGRDPFRHRRFQIIGERGSFLIEPLEPPSVHLYLSEAQGEFPAGWSTPQIPARPRYDGDIEDLAAWIQGRRKPQFTPDHDLAVHEILLQICGESG